MLVRYKKSLEKIAMGLLSFMPQEKDVKHLMETMQHYETDENWLLYLWKKGEEYVGVIGIVKQGSTAVIQHITVIPSYRGEGVAMEMLQEIKEIEAFESIEPNEETAPFIDRCMSSFKEENSQ